MFKNPYMQVQMNMSFFYDGHLTPDNVEEKVRELGDVMGIDGRVLALLKKVHEIVSAFQDDPIGKDDLEALIATRKLIEDHVPFARDVDNLISSMRERYDPDALLEELKNDGTDRTFNMLLVFRRAFEAADGSSDYAALTLIHAIAPSYFRFKEECAPILAFVEPFLTVAGIFPDYSFLEKYCKKQAASPAPENVVYNYSLSSIRKGYLEWVDKAIEGDSPDAPEILQVLYTIGSQRGEFKGTIREIIPGRGILLGDLCVTYLHFIDWFFSVPSREPLWIPAFDDILDLGVSVGDKISFRANVDSYIGPDGLRNYNVCDLSSVRRISGYKIPTQDDMNRQIGEAYICNVVCPYAEPRSGKACRSCKAPVGWKDEEIRSWLIQREIKARLKSLLGDPHA